MRTRLNLAAAARRTLAFALLLSSATLLSGMTLADVSSPAPTHSPGVWQKHQYSFQYMGFTSTYSCDGLADKLKVLLLAAGARADVKSEPGACAQPFGRPDKFARADLTFYTLAPDPADAGSGAKPVDGMWRPVAFMTRSPRQLQIGDCEVVEQFRNLVLPMFTTRSIDNHMTCVPYQESGSVIDLKFESFAAVPAPPPAAVPPAGGPQPRIFMYPKNGQSEQQQVIDWRECQQWASQNGVAANTPDYHRALVACLTGRGYSVN